MCEEERFVNATYTSAADKGLSPRILNVPNLIPDFHKVANLYGKGTQLFLFFIIDIRVFFCLYCNALQYLQWLNQRKTRPLNDVLLVAFFCASIRLNVVISLRPVAAGGNQGFPFDAIQCRRPLAGFPTYIQTHT